MARALFLDRSIGEARGVVTLDGRPERLIIERDGEPPSQRLGARSVARVRRIERGLGSAFLEMPDGPDAVAPAADLVEGRAVEVEIRAEARTGKGAMVFVVGQAEGPPRLSRPAPDLAARLSPFAPGVEVAEGRSARAQADEAEAVALAVIHPLPGGGTIAIEPTRALTAIDIDMGGRGGRDVRQAARQVNLLAIAEAARVLRLKGLGGLVVIDLVGKGHDGRALSAAAKAAFAPDGEGVRLGPISGLGLFELSTPRTIRPVAEILGEGPEVSVLTAALRLLRAVEREGAAHPGSRLEVRCASDVAAALQPFTGVLAERLGARFSILAEPGRAREGGEAVAI